MATRGAKVIMSRMKLTDKSVAGVVPKYGQGIITIDHFYQLNEKSVEGICRLLRRLRGTIGGVSNTGVSVSEMAEANVQGMIYYIKHFKSIGYTCAHAYVELSKARAMYHQWEMEGAHKEPKVVPTVNPR